MKRIQFSAPQWWHDAARAKARDAGLSLSSLIRHTLTLAWDLQPPENADDHEGDHNDEREA